MYTATLIDMITSLGVNNDSYSWTSNNMDKAPWKYVLCKECRHHTYTFRFTSMDTSYIFSVKFGLSHGVHYKQIMLKLEKCLKAATFDENQPTK